jgi:hypothetical protein
MQQQSALLLVSKLDAAAAALRKPEMYFSNAWNCIHAGEFVHMIGAHSSSTAEQHSAVALEVQRSEVQCSIVKCLPDTALHLVRVCCLNGGLITGFSSGSTSYGACSVACKQTSNLSTLYT